MDYILYGDDGKVFNGTRQSNSILGEHSFGVLALAVFILKTVFAQVQLSPLYFTHTDLPSGRIDLHCLMSV